MISHNKIEAGSPCFVNSIFVFFNSFCRISIKSTFAPAFSKDNAIAFPLPLDAPVTTAFFPFNENNDFYNKLEISAV